MFHIIKFLFFLLFCFKSYAQSSTDLLKNEIDSLLSSIQENQPGLSIHVQQGNQVLYSKSKGLSDLKTKEKFSENTLSNIGGISKTFIAYSILILQKQGKLSIEDPINLYFTNFKNKEIASLIKVKHLMMHTSGFRDSPLSIKDSLLYLKITDEQNFETLKQIDKLASVPGTNFSFCDKAYSGLVLIIEKVSNLKFHEFVKQNILVPSGMSFTKVTDKYFSTEKVAHAYLKFNKKYKEYDIGECPKMETISSAGVWSNIVDLRKYIYAIKYNLFLDSVYNKLLEANMISLHANNLNSSYHNLCWFGFHPKNKDNFIEYSGSQCAFRSSIIFFPEKDLTIFYLSNNRTDYSQKLMNELKIYNFIN